MTQIETARKNLISELVKQISCLEGVSAESLRKKIKTGRVVILNNRYHRLKKPCAVGEGLRTKVNANLGVASEEPDLARELEKLDAAIAYGADALMDLSTGGDLGAVRRAMIERSSVPLGTVPVYEVALRAQKEKGDLTQFGISQILEVLQSQAQDGVDFFTIHAGVTQKSLAALKKQKRLLDIVSRGGAMLANWIVRHKKENPFYQYFDRILELAYQYDITLSLGDGLRPGSVLDANDKGQFAELAILGELTQRARARNVQVIIEGPGHVPLDQVKKNIILEKKLCQKAPFYLLGPLVTDVGAGYDHISSAIGGALAAAYGADFLCYVTPAEHLRHPTVEDVREGVIASRISAHAGDLVKKIPAAANWDKEMSQARKKRDWEKQIALSVDPAKAQAYRESSRPKLEDVCTMCGQYCSIKLMEECVRA